MLSFEIDVSRTYKNKEGYDVSGYKLNTSFVTETHTPQSFLESVVTQGWPYTMAHQKRSPEQSGGIVRNPKLTTPKHTENFLSSQVLTFDDDSKAADVIAFWLDDSFFSQYGWAFVESVSSVVGTAEKGHPTLILDQPLTDPVLYKECLTAFIETYPRLDPLKNIDRTIYNAEGARVHFTHDGEHTICPFSAFKAAILDPWRKAQAEAEAAEQAQKEAAEAARARARDVIQAHGLGQGVGDVDTANPHRLQAFVAGRVKWIVEKFSNASKGRHGLLFWAGREIGALGLAEWARPFGAEWAGVESDIIQAAYANGYYKEHAHSEAEVLRVFAEGRAHSANEPTPEPSQSATPLHLSTYKKCKGVADYVLQDGQYLADVATLDALPRLCILDAPTGTGKSTLATQGERVILAVSTQLAAEQLHLKQPATVGMFYGGVDRVTGNMPVIACVYDSLPRLLEKYSFIDDTWALVIDEQHNLALADYRHKALDALLGIAHGRDWRQVVFMSGTPLDMPHGQGYERVTVRRATQRAHPAVFVNYASGNRLAVTAQIAHLHVTKGERVLIYLNSKGNALNRLQGELGARGVQGVYTLNTDNKLEKAGRAVIENERLPEDCQVLITTAVLVESANLLTDVGAAIIASAIHPAYAHQFVSRARTNAPMCYILNNGKGLGYGIETRPEIANTWKEAEKLADVLNGLARPWDRDRGAAIAGNVARLVKDDGGAWAASLLGVLQHVTKTVTSYCWGNPNAFSRATLGYGWVWAATEDYTETSGAAEAKELTDQLNEQTEAAWLKTVKDVGELGEQTAALVVGADGQTRRVLEHALKISDTLKERLPLLSWAAAVGLLATAKDTGHSLKRLTRAVRLWTMEDDPALAMLYANAPLDTPLPREMRYSLVIDTLAKDDQLRVFTRYVKRRTWEEESPMLTEQNADELLEVLFDVSKKRIVQDGERVSVWILTGKVDILARAEAGHKLLAELNAPAEAVSVATGTAVAQSATPLHQTTPQTATPLQVEKPKSATPLHNNIKIKCKALADSSQSLANGTAQYPTKHGGKATIVASKGNGIFVTQSGTKVEISDGIAYDLQFVGNGTYRKQDGALVTL